jgi:hypothetical protein
LASTFSLGVVIFDDWQNGQAVGAGVVSGFGVVFMRRQIQPLPSSPAVAWARLPSGTRGSADVEASCAFDLYGIWRDRHFVVTSGTSCSSWYQEREEALRVMSRELGAG